MGSITATNLATYQHLSCDLYIHNAYQNPRSTTATTSGNRKQTESLKAEFQRGLEWEQQLLSHLDNQGLLLRVPHVPVTANSLLENIAADERSHFFISGVSFFPPNNKLEASFQQYGSHPVQFGLAKPDLIEIKRVDNKLKWRVLDAKASRQVKTSHHIQIYFYTICLNEFLHQQVFLGTNQPAVWLPPYNRPQDIASFSDIHAIPLSLLDASFRPLLFRDLPRIIHSTPDDIDWHYNAACRDCQYQTTCESKVMKEGLLNNISNLSKEDGQILKQLLGIARRETPSASTDRLPDIEELHEIFTEPRRIEAVRKIAPEILAQSERVLMLGQISGNRRTFNGSVLTQAVKSKTAKAIPSFNYNCPSEEDIAVVISVFDPRTLLPSNFLYCISVYATATESTSQLCESTTIIQELADVIRRIDACREGGRKPSSQFYTWNATEHAHLQSLLRSEGPAFREDDRQTCLQALAQGTSVMESVHCPRILQKTLVNFLKRGSRSDCRVLCDRLGLLNQGSREMLEKRIENRISLLRTEHESSGRETGLRRVGELAPIVSLKSEIERHLVIPIPGSWDLQEYASNLMPKGEYTACSTEEMLRAHHERDTRLLEDILKRRNNTIYSVLQDFRNRAKSDSGSMYLVNKATTISLQNPILCEEPHIRRLFAMQQLEVLSRLNSLWRMRIEQHGDATILTYRETLGDEHIFDVVHCNTKKHHLKESGLLPYNFLLTKVAADQNIDFPTEALFDDIAMADANPQADNTLLSGWTQQDMRVRENILLGHVTRMSFRHDETTGLETATLTIRTWGEKSLLFPGTNFRLSPRLVDFNSPKILASLFETDVKWGALQKSTGNTSILPHNNIPLLQIITNSVSLRLPTPGAKLLLETAHSIQESLTTIAARGVRAADVLVLKPSQRRAVDSILRNRLSVVWGPPGTGKTHTIALSLLRLLEAEHPTWRASQYTIIVTAVTHTAIQECYKKLISLVDGYRCSKLSNLEWIEDIDIQIINGLISRSSNSRKRARIWLGTIYQVSKILKFHSTEADCVVVDEASQLPLNLLSLAVQFLRNNGRVVIAGDSEQLAPIFATKCSSTHSHPSFKSVLEHLLSKPSTAPNEIASDGTPIKEGKPQSGEGYVTQLRENFRLHPDACEFISTIYADDMESQGKAQTAIRALASSQNIPAPHGSDATIFYAVKSFLQSLYIAIQTRTQKVPDTPNKLPSDQAQSLSLALVCLGYPSDLSRITHEARLKTEASVAYALAHLLHKCSPTSKIAIATPYRDQKDAVQSLISKAYATDSSDGLAHAMERLDVNNTILQPKIVVETIERLQGSEADFVICLFSMLQKKGDDSFIFDRRRLNVAITRSKALCILITSEEVLRPTASVLANENTLKGYQFLKAYEERAWCYDLPVTGVDGQ